MTRDERREIIELTISDLVADFLYYDRKEDEDLPINAIKDAVMAGVISKQEILECFAKHLHKGL